MRESVLGLGILALFMTLALTGLCRAGSDQTRPIEGKDDLGRTVILAKPPQRIVLLSGSPIDTIFELGAGHLLVGVVDSIADSYPDLVKKYPSVLEKERIGRFSDPNMEKIIALDPDLILPFASPDAPGKFTDVFEKRGLPYAAVCSVENMASGIAQIERLGKLLDREKEARALVSKIRTEVDGLTRLISSRTRTRPRVYYWWGAKNGTYGSRAAVHELIERAGGINLAGEFKTQYMELSPEYVIAGNPDVIVISYWKESDREPRIAALKQRPGFENITAVKNNRIYTLDGHAFHSPIRFAETISTLAGYIHPELLDDKGRLAGIDNEK